MAEIEKIKAALADPHAPWYGSDIVEWVSDLVKEYEELAVKSATTPQNTKGD